MTVDPVSEFVLRKLIDFKVPLDAVGAAEVIRIRGNIDSLGIPDAVSNLDSAFAALEKAAGSYVDSQAQVIAAGPAADPAPVLGTWRVAGLRLEMGHRTDGVGTFGTFSENAGFALETVGGQLVVRPGVVEGTTRFVEQSQSVSGHHDLYGPEVELDPLDPGAAPIAGVLRLLGDRSFAFDLGVEEDVIPENNFARRQASGTEILHFAGDSLRVGLNRAYEQLYGVSGNQLDEANFRGERLLSMLSVAGREPATLTASDFNGNKYGLVEFGVDLGANYVGAAGYLHELSFNAGAGTVTSAADDEVELEHHYGIAPVRHTPNESFVLDYAIDGKQLVLSDEGKEAIRFSVAGDADAFFASNMVDDGTIEQALLLAVKLPSTQPDMDGRRYRIQGMGTRMHRVGDQDHLAIELEGHGELVFEGSNVSLQGWRSRMIERFRTTDGPTVTVSGPDNGPVVSVAHGATPGAITFTADKATFKGFVSADGRVLVLRHDLADDAGQSLGMWIGLRVD